MYALTVHGSCKPSMTGQCHLVALCGCRTRKAPGAYEHIRLNVLS